MPMAREEQQEHWKAGILVARTWRAGASTLETAAESVPRPRSGWPAVNSRPIISSICACQPRIGCSSQRCRPGRCPFALRQAKTRGMLPASYICGSRSLDWPHTGQALQMRAECGSRVERLVEGSRQTSDDETHLIYCGARQDCSISAEPLQQRLHTSVSPP